MLSIYLSVAPEHLPKAFHTEVILIHPSAMQLLEISLGQPVVVKDLANLNQSPEVYTAWPHPAGALTSVAYIQGTSSTPATSSHVRVEALRPPHFPAYEVHVQAK